MTTAHHFEATPTKTYATKANAIKAVEKKFGPNHEFFGDADVRYMILTHTDGRFFPVFFGERALRHQVHFHFNVVA